MSRDYETIAAALIQSLGAGVDDERRMRAVVDLLWGHLHDHGVSWVGFYLFDAEHDEMILGPSRDKPACSPIGMHGACGQAFRNRRPLIVRDVKELGDGYVACDPKDQSEIVVPVCDARGKPIGVLDLDSFELGAFDESDATGLARVLSAAGLWPE